MSKEIVGSNYSFTVITNYLIRMEQNSQGEFEDGQTQTIKERNFADVDVQVLEKHSGHELEIITPGFHLFYDGGAFAPDTLYVDVIEGHTTYQNRWFYGLDNNDEKNNLGGTISTLDHANGEVELGKGIMSKSGFSFLDDSDSFIYDEETDSFYPRKVDTIDGYLFMYGHSYQKQLTDFYHLTGSTPIIPRYALGNWWSRFYKYSQDEYQALMQKFDEKKIPISVACIDMDWHWKHIAKKYGPGWTGFSWNTDLFPDHQKLLDWLHDDGKKVTLNLHPANGIRAFEDAYPAVAKTMKLDTEKEETANFDINDPLFRKAYFKDVLEPLEDEGVDFWWVDWQQGATKKATELDPLWLLNHYHFNRSKRNNNGTGLTLSRYAGPGSHRYPLGFSGDTHATWGTLDFQPYFTSTASNIGYTWWSHDIGGHMHGSFDGELESRWIQFGAFSPINRLHASDNPFSGKEPWRYRADYQAAQIKFLQLRTALVPYLETANIKTHDQGVPLVRPLYYQYPESKQAYAQKNQYLFGDEFLVSPITKPHDEVTQRGSVTTWLPEGKWVDYMSHLPYEGDTLIDNYRLISEMPLFVKQGSIIVTNQNYMEDASQLPEELQVEIFPGEDATYVLKEHVGDDFAVTTFKWDDQAKKLTYSAEDSGKIIPEKRNIQVKVVEYKRADIFAELYDRLYESKIDFDLKKEIYREFMSDNYSYEKFTNFISHLENDDLRKSISEVAFVRKSFV